MRSAACVAGGAGRREASADPAAPFDLLVYLIEHRERVLSIDELLDAIWGRQIVQPSSLTVAVNRIRSVLGDGDSEIIRTHHRVGYRFVAELEDEDAVIALPSHATPY